MEILRLELIIDLEIWSLIVGGWNLQAAGAWFKNGGYAWKIEGS